MLAERFSDRAMAADVGELGFHMLSVVCGVEALIVLLHATDRTRSARPAE
jgi:hypothetical protein